MTIHPDLTVNELVLGHPGALPVLAGAGIDTCCGGGLTLALAAAQAGLTFDQLLDRLQRGGSAGDAASRPACGCSPKPA